MNISQSTYYKVAPLTLCTKHGGLHLIVIIMSTFQQSLGRYNNNLREPEPSDQSWPSPTCTSEADEADKEPQTEERRQYEELHSYLLREDYPPRATKAEKGVIRKRAKKFELVDITGV